MDGGATPMAETSPPAAALPYFRGRIFVPWKGYKVRAMLELDIRAAIAAILTKPQWWLKWQRDNGALRDKWLNELEDLFIADTFYRSTSDWHIWWLANAVPLLYAPLSTPGSDEEKRALVDSVCSTIPYNMLWHYDWCQEMQLRREDTGVDPTDPSVIAERLRTESEESFRQGNERMSSYGQITWYFEMELLNRSLRAMPLSQVQPPGRLRLGSVQAVAHATQFIRAVHHGDVTRETFRACVPGGDDRPHIVDALWFHVDRILTEIKQIRNCIIRTLDLEIEKNRLDAEETVTQFVSPGPVQETWMSDLAVAEALKRKFTAEVAVLENVPEDQKDWHPNSDKQVLDLVHPSLFCCVFGTTKQMPTPLRDDALSVVERMHRMMYDATQVAENEHHGSATYQWIPSDFAVAANGDVSIRSYINNLHPVKHAAMYDSIAQIFQAFVPMFDRVLSCLLNEAGPPPVMIYPLYGRAIEQIPVHPRIPASFSLEPTMSQPFSLCGSHVQVIVKIAEIVLTPENPTYAGGSWHVEGSDAEQIVATGLYYFGCDNITESRLSFRVIVEEPEYRQDDTLGMKVMYGLGRNQRLVQPLGSVTAIEDRCVVFPNTLQHHVEPFELADKIRPGVRKILAFFVVDPSKRIPSTSVIPPQQADWIREALAPTLGGLQTARSIPDGVMGSTIKTMLGHAGMTLEEAKEHRLGLMNERRPEVLNDEDVDEDEGHELFFSLCEH